MCIMRDTNNYYNESVGGDHDKNQRSLYKHSQGKTEESSSFNMKIFWARRGPF